MTEMKNILIIVLLILCVGCKNDKKNSTKVDHSQHNKTAIEKPIEKKKVLSPHTSSMAMVGDAHIHIDYSSPGVRNRIIFGGLVGYDVVWQAGAHNATWLETNKDLMIDNKLLKTGKYGFFVIPSKEEWTIIFNTNWDQHGKDEYNEKDDVIRFKVNAEVSDEIIEHLEYKVLKENETSGVISLAWEKVTVSFPFSIN
jgi:hypothetical protein